MSNIPHAVSLPLIRSSLVTPPTAAALLGRAEKADEPYKAAFFAPEDFAALSRVCARLLGEPSAVEAATTGAVRLIPREIDRRLSRGESDGWRYDTLPPDAEAYRAGLEVLGNEAARQFGKRLAALDDGQIDKLLQQMQHSRIEQPVRAPFDSVRWFEELLAESVEIYYSHPDTLQEIGYVGFADAPGWQHVGLGELEAREAAALPQQE